MLVTLFRGGSRAMRFVDVVGIFIVFIAIRDKIFSGVKGESAVICSWRGSPVCLRIFDFSIGSIYLLLG